jgi:CubicO group peptidase (beta-lactamase class C family)
MGALAGAKLVNADPLGGQDQAKPVDARQPSGDRFKKVDEIVSAEFAREGAASITVGIVNGADLVWSKSYGLAKVEDNQAANVSNIYRIGSITKQFTAIGFLQLVQKGTLHLTDPVEKYVPEINVVSGRPTYSPPITLIQLATHTSGLDREPADANVYTAGPVKDWEQTLFTALKHTKYLYEPGTRQSYSNLGYAVLGVAVGRAAGLPYITYAKQNILDPLGLKDTQFELDSVLLPRLAHGYDDHDGKTDGADSARELQTGRGYKVPNGALFTTVEDLSKFVSFELGHGPKTLLDASFYEDIHKRIFADDENLDGGYGIGFQLIRRNNLILDGHGGSVAGYTAGAYYNKKASFGIVYLRNYGRPLRTNSLFDIAEVFV